MVEAIACHHQPLSTAKNKPLASIVHISDAVTLQMGMGLGIDGLMYPLSEEALKVVGVTGDDLEFLMADIVDLFIDKDMFS